MKKKILIVVANYYKDITIDLIKSAKKSLPLVLKRNSDIMFVPGVFEIPVIISKNIKKYHGFIALGCVVTNVLSTSFDLSRILFLFFL